MNGKTDFVAQLGLPFLAHRLRRAAETFRDGYGEWLPEAGVVAPARSLSTILLLDEQGPSGVVEIAARIGFSHPLVIRLVRDLEAIGLVQVAKDATDGRKRAVSLTSKGRAEVERIRAACVPIAKVYDELSAEVGVDLMAMVERLEAAEASDCFPDRLRKAVRQGSRKSAVVETMDPSKKRIRI